MFYIIEIQEDHEGHGAIVTPIQTAETKDEAMSKYHGILMYAAVSALRNHTCMVVDGTGQYFARETYHHPAPVESQGEEE